MPAVLSTARLHPATARVSVPAAHPPNALETLEYPYTSKFSRFPTGRRRAPNDGRLPTITEETSTPKSEPQEAVIRFHLPWPNACPEGVPRIIVRPATPPATTVTQSAELERDCFVLKRAERLRDEKRARRDSLDGLAVIKCPRLLKKSVGRKVVEWTREHCFPRAPVTYLDAARAGW